MALQVSVRYRLDLATIAMADILRIPFLFIMFFFHKVKHRENEYALHKPCGDLIGVPGGPAVGGPCCKKLFTKTEATFDV